MAITAAGLFGLTLEKMFTDASGESLEAETHKMMLLDDTATPDFDTDEFEDDLNGDEIAGTGYSAGGVAATSTEVTLSGGVLKFDAADTVFSTVTISGVMAGVYKFEVGSAATNQLVLLQDFVTAGDATAADFTVQHPTAGLFTLDYTP